MGRTNTLPSEPARMALFLGADPRFGHLAQADVDGTMAQPRRLLHACKTDANNRGVRSLGDQMASRSE